eukprot:Blabericola_migrator_1__531@NODE_112_length_13896_cov_27_724275_g100_i0_p11_GENE_NODE_112_length_13896_cov_27_724275_g100_i0NODE_112_length_13896_cov_27_724275_g100_i0_p11_ORF_typecomplete_len101_score15_05US6/PF17616_2/0_0092_NODE_112_length_13896_cov_27_724275_g100_i01144411746
MSFLFEQSSHTGSQTTFGPDSTAPMRSSCRIAFKCSSRHLPCDVRTSPSERQIEIFCVSQSATLQLHLILEGVGICLITLGIFEYKIDITIEILVQSLNL